MSLFTLIVRIAQGKCTQNISTSNPYSATTQMKPQFRNREFDKPIFQFDKTNLLIYLSYFFYMKMILDLQSKYI